MVRRHLTHLGDEALLHDEISNIEGAVAAEAEAGEALPRMIDELVRLEPLAELLQDLWEGRRDVHLLLRIRDTIRRSRDAADWIRSVHAGQAN